MKEIEFSRWLFELPTKQHSQFSPSGSIFQPCLSLPSKSHHENSICSIFLESLHQLDIKNVVKSSKHFFGYFNTLESKDGYFYSINEKYQFHLNFTTQKIASHLRSREMAFNFIHVFFFTKKNLRPGHLFHSGNLSIFIHMR